MNNKLGITIVTDESKLVNAYANNYDGFSI